MRLIVRVCWTQWCLGVWWWPVKKDRVIGINLGPLSLTWVAAA